MPKRPTKYPDLLKSSKEYQAHRHEIDDLLARTGDLKGEIIRTLQNAEKRTVADRGSGKGYAHIDEIERPEHINCQGLQPLFHAVSLESFRRDNNEKEAAKLRPLLIGIASTRLSIMNFALNNHPIDYTDRIQQADERLKSLVGPEIDVPSLVPYYFKPNSTISALKKMVGDRKFENSELLMDLGELFASDPHILHSVCIALASNGIPEHIEPVLQARAEIEFPQFRHMALTPLFQTHADLFVAHIIGLVESEQTDKALSWCEKGLFKPLLTQNKELALKYVAALRHQGRFHQVKTFCEDNKDNPALEDRKFGQEVLMAIAECRDVMPMSADEFFSKYPHMRSKRSQ